MSRLRLHLVIPLALAACATSPHRAQQPHPIEHERISPEWPATTLGDAVRLAGQAGSGGLVAMYGIENTAVEPRAFKSIDYGYVANDLASQSQCKIEDFRGYYFLYPPGYEALTELSLEGRVPESYDDTVVSLVLGSGTPLYTAFAFLGHLFDVSIVADNAVAEARCGEINFSQITLREALEAVLRSARVASDAIVVEERGAIVFIRASLVPPAGESFVIDKSTASDELWNKLETNISVVLPEAPVDPAHFERHAGGAPLAEVLPSLSEQLGVPVRIERELAMLPVNPVVLNGVTPAMALDILIRQWPAREFGYTFDGQTVVIRRKAPSRG